MRRVLTRRAREVSSYLLHLVCLLYCMDPVKFPLFFFLSDYYVVNIEFGSKAHQTFGVSMVRPCSREFAGWYRVLA